MYLQPDAVFENLPKFGKINLRNPKVHKCPNYCLCDFGRIHQHVKSEPFAHFAPQSHSIPIKTNSTKSKAAFH